MERSQLQGLISKLNLHPVSFEAGCFFVIWERGELRRDIEYLIATYAARLGAFLTKLQSVTEERGEGSGLLCLYQLNKQFSFFKKSKFGIPSVRDGDCRLQYTSPRSGRIPKEGDARQDAPRHLQALFLLGGRRSQRGLDAEASLKPRGSESILAR